MKLKDEEALIGNWVLSGKSVVKDDTTLRIEWLINNHLNKITTDESGWETLYKDPDQNTYWELIYKDSEMHGAGAPSLIRISFDDAKKKYKLP